MKTDNELIAEFMGLTVFQPDEELGGAGNDIEFDWCYRDDLKYDTSWDWLMPVVEKIVEVSCSYSPNVHGAAGMALKLFAEFPITSRIDRIHRGVVEFIKWYQTQNANCAKCGGTGFIGDGPTSFNKQKCDCQLPTLNAK